MAKSWELTGAQKDKVRKIEEVKRNEMQDLHEYNQYVVQQKKLFEKIMFYINELINNLRDYGEISEYTEVRARIKAPKSALNNDSIKTLDDTFGMEVITITEHEMKVVMEKIQQFMSIQKSKDHDKPNGYKAKHRIMTFKKDELERLGLEEEMFDVVPMIEFQFKTFETIMRCLKGPAEHTIYKGEKKEIIQEKYDNNEYNVFEVPTMWVSKNGEMCMLTMEETLKKMYPFIRTKKLEPMTKEMKGE